MLRGRKMEFIFQRNDTFRRKVKKKAMADQIEQMGVMLKTTQKQVEELQEKYNTQVQKSSDLSCKRDATEKDLDRTRRLLAKTEEELSKSHYTLKERDFIISEQRKAENDLSHQACVLRSDLEKSLQDNALLFSKIAREDKLNSKNKSVVNDFQEYLAEKIGALCNTVATSMSQQNEHLHSVEKLCHSLLNFHEKMVSELKNKLAASRVLYVSHLEAVQNVVCFHKASNNAGLEDISSLVSSNSSSMKQFLDREAQETNSIFDGLQGTLSSHQGEMALFTRELRERFHISIEHARESSDVILGLLNKLGEELHGLESHTTQVHEIQQNSIIEFQKA